jgi:tetratricopeptide (TPR) repeat protein
MKRSTVRTPASQRHWLAHLPTRLSKFGRALLAAGVIWPSLAIALLLLACVISWISVPPIHSYGGWELAIDLGWGVQSKLVSYGLLSLLIALICLGRTLAAFDWKGYWFDHSAPWRPRPLRPRSLLAMGWLATVPSLLFLFQFLLADLHLTTMLADQENLSLLIRQHLGYRLASQRLPMRPFQISSATLDDRLGLLIQLANLGVLLPLIGGVFCLYGAYQARRKREISLRARLYEGGVARTRSIWRRPAFWIAASILGLILLGRAPAGLVYEYFGRQALIAGQYQTALDLFSQAQALNPALDSMASFHQERGEALYRLHYQANLDVGLYLAASYRKAGALDQAWLQDQSLAQRYPHDALLQQDMAVTLEALIEHNTSVAQLPVNEEAAQQNPQLPIKITNKALGWLDKLLQLEPDNLYAHYLRGRIYFATHTYELATRDFEDTLTLSTDRDMQSAAYTYLAFCRAGVGDYVGERSFLEKAIELDNGYYNTTAREAASGLH